MKALIKVGYACNEHCTFCHTQQLRHIDGGADEITAKIHRAHALGHTMVVLSGGEPTIREELFRWAGLVAHLGMDLGLVTNGLLLAYPELLARLMGARLRYVYMSLHAGEAAIHDRIVRAGSFAAATAAIANLQGHGLAPTLNCVVTRQNLAHLRGLVDAATAWPDVTLKFSACEPKGGAMRLLDIVVPRLRDTAAAILDALQYARERLGPGRARHGGVPLCLLPGFESDYDDLRTHRYWTMVEVGEPDLLPVDDRNKLHPSPHCDDCAIRGGCPGVFREYHGRHGHAELAPPRAGLRSNSFSWVLEQVYTPTGVADHCPLLDPDGPGGGSLDPWEPARHLFVRHRDRLARYRCDSRDFDDDAIATVKHAHGQVYLDASRKPAIDDLARDLVKLVRSPICAPCRHRHTCTGLFEPALSFDLADAEAELRARLAELGGDVLEIGCGSGRITAVWRDAIARGAVRWCGIEPDRDALARLHERVPGAQGRAGLAEDELAKLPEASVDHAVIAHAWNHLDDPARVIDELARVLRPGGELWIFDDVPFGLARTGAQQARAAAATAAWEHLRNDDAGAAAARIVHTELVALERRDIAPDTGNQWLIRYRRSPA